MEDTPEHHRQRSEFIRGLVQRVDGPLASDERYARGTPKDIIQYWHDLRKLPKDVAECIESWKDLAKNGFTHKLFDEDTAKEFIRTSLGGRHVRAFERCYHPAMQADYFRLCYLVVKGGFYVDADDVCISSQIDWLFEDGRLKVQPLCYDVSSETMVCPSEFLRVGEYVSSWIFYFNNNPIISSKSHPILSRALHRATTKLEAFNADSLPEIQATTGPGNLSKSIFDLGTTTDGVTGDLFVLRNWGNLAVSRWPLSYRDDARNWRHSNQQKFSRSQG